MLMFALYKDPHVKLWDASSLSKMPPKRSYPGDGSASAPAAQRSRRADLMPDGPNPLLPHTAAQTRYLQMGHPSLLPGAAPHDLRPVLNPHDRLPHSVISTNTRRHLDMYMERGRQRFDLTPYDAVEVALPPATQSRAAHLAHLRRYVQGQAPILPTSVSMRNTGRVHIPKAMVRERYPHTALTDRELAEYARLEHLRRLEVSAHVANSHRAHMDSILEDVPMFDDPVTEELRRAHMAAANALYRTGLRGMQDYQGHAGPEMRRRREMRQLRGELAVLGQLPEVSAPGAPGLPRALAHNIMSYLAPGHPTSGVPL